MRQLRLPITTRILAVSGLSLGIFAISLLSVVRRTVTRAVYSEVDAAVQVAQNVMRELLSAKGEPAIVDGRLVFGTWSPRGDDSLVDRLNALTEAEATLFQIVGDKPIRVSTTTAKLDGSGRNVGSELVGPARVAFDSGQSFAGTVSVAGRDYIARYDALRDVDGDLVGIVYTGIPLTRMFAAAEETMRVVMTGMAIALLPSLAALYLTTRPVRRTFFRAVEVAQGLALGNVDQETDTSFLNDELADVNRAFSKMIEYQRRMAGIADAISQGDLSNEVEPASSVDRLGIAFARMTFNLREIVSQLEESALTDSLTQLGNRRAFDTHLESEISRTARHGGILTLALVDVDEFKSVNDEYGHQRGDMVLAMLGSILKSARLEDVGYRLGGDEFALILPDTTALEAKTLVDRLRETMKARAFGTTVTIGIATSLEGLVDSQTLQHRADTAMYLGKQRGRDAVVVFEESMNHPERATPAMAPRRLKPEAKPRL